MSIFFFFIPIASIALLFVKDADPERKKTLNFFIIANCLLYFYPVIRAFLNTPKGESMFDENKGGGAALWMYFYILPITIIAFIVFLVLKSIYAPKTDEEKQNNNKQAMVYHKEIKGDELYLYLNGNLIYKKWLKTGESNIFDATAYDNYTNPGLWPQYEHKTSNPGIICVKALLNMKTTESGGRETGFTSGYRPNHVFEYSETGKLVQTYIGEIQFEGQSTIEPGEKKEVIVRFIFDQPIEKHLNQGQIWWIHEGPRIIGEAEIIDILNPL